MNRIRTLLAKRPALMLMLLLAVLGTRALVPAGWMPSARAGQVMVICTGAGTAQIWVDSTGKVHKGEAPNPNSSPQPCAFAGLAMAADAGAAPMALPILPHAADAPKLLSSAAAIGQGLAAPPPPATGPPILI